MATLPEGALMQRAAAGLASAVLDLLGRAYGRRVLLLVGRGQRRRRAVRRRAAGPARRAGRGVAAVRQAHAAGLAALTAPAGGRDHRGAPPSARPRRRRDRRHRRPARAAARGRSRRSSARPASRSSRSTYRPGVDVDTGELAGPARHGRRHGHLRHPQGRATSPTRRPQHAGAVHLVDIGLDLPAAAVESPPARRRARLLPRPDARRPQVHPRRGRRPRRLARRTPAPACSASPARRAGSAGWCGTSPAPATRCRRAPRGGDAKAACRRGSVGSGGGATWPTMLAEALADGVPIVVDADALAHVAGPLGVPAVLTPHAGELAAHARRRPRGGRGRAAARTPARRRGRTTRSCCSRAGTPWSRGPTAGSRVTTTGVPWLATAGAGDVLGRPDRRAARRRARPVRRRVGRLVAARRRRDVRLAGRADHRPRRRPARSRRSCASLPDVMEESCRMPSAEIVVDLAAIRHNVARWRALVAPASR